MGRTKGELSLYLMARALWVLLRKSLVKPPWSKSAAHMGSVKKIIVEAINCHQHMGSVKNIVVEALQCRQSHKKGIRPAFPACAVW